MIPLLLLLTVFLGYSIRSAPWCREHGSKDESYYTLILIIRTAILADTRVPQKRHFRPASAHFIMKRQPPAVSEPGQRKDILEAARRIIYGPVELTHPYLLLLR